MQALAERLEAPVRSVDLYGWRGDSLEAEAFAYLAVRALYGLPLSLPTTTRVASTSLTSRRTRGRNSTREKAARARRRLISCSAAPST